MYNKPSSPNIAGVTYAEQNIHVYSIQNVGGGTVYITVM